MGPGCGIAYQRRLPGEAARRYEADVDPAISWPLDQCARLLADIAREVSPAARDWRLTLAV